MSNLPDLELYKTAGESHRKAIETLKDVEGIVLSMFLQPIASGAVKTSDVKGGNPMGLPAKNQQCMYHYSLINTYLTNIPAGLAISADFKNPKDEEFVHKVCRDVVDTVEAVGKKNGTYLPYQYSNYSAKDQNPLASYGVENLRKLKDIALRYDPEGVFQTLQSGGWLVSKA